jgi:aspartate kinase
MALVVQKYGGSSVASPERLLAVARRLIAAKERGDRVVAVVSAMGDVTDELLAKARSISSDPPEREMDMLLATGEQVTIALLAMAIHAQGHEALSLTGAQAGIVSDSVHTKARIQEVRADRVMEALDDGNIVIIAGFQGLTPEGEITTLGRGGSDTTAVAVAAGLSADVCEIYTDVDGVYTCDPRVVPDARKLDVIDYDELLEMASSGSKVMQSRSVEFAKKFQVPFEVRSSFNTNRGTIVKEEPLGLENVVVRGISIERNQAKVTITHVPDKPGTASRIFTALAEANMSIDVIVQNVSVSGTTDISFTMNGDELEKLGGLIDAVAKEIGAGEVTKKKGVAKLSVVGIGMRSHSGVAAKLFECLGNGSVNIQMISTSEIKIAVIIDEAKIESAAKLAHEAFGLAAAG